MSFKEQMNIHDQMRWELNLRWFNEYKEKLSKATYPPARSLYIEGMKRIADEYPSANLHKEIPKAGKS